MNVSATSQSLVVKHVGADERVLKTEAATPSRASVSEDKGAKFQEQFAQNAIKSKRNESIEKSLEEINDRLNAANRSLRFSIDPNTDKTVIKVVDIRTNEVVKQFPPEAMIGIAKSVDRFLESNGNGFLIKEKA